MDFAVPSTRPLFSCHDVLGLGGLLAQGMNPILIAAIARTPQNMETFTAEEIFQMFFNGVHPNDIRAHRARQRHRPSHPHGVCLLLGSLAVLLVYRENAAQVELGREARWQAMLLEIYVRTCSHLFMYLHLVAFRTQAAALLAPLAQQLPRLKPNIALAWYFSPSTAELWPAAHARQHGAEPHAHHPVHPGHHLDALLRLQLRVPRL